MTKRETYRETRDATAFTVRERTRAVEGETSRADSAAPRERRALTMTEKE